MAKTSVTLRKPLNEKVALIQLGFSKEEFDLVKAYNKKALVVFEKDSSRVLYEVDMAERADIGATVLHIPANVTREGDMLFSLNGVDLDNITQTANLANLVEYGDKITKQVKAAVKAYNKAKESITIEGAVASKEEGEK